MTVTPDFQGTHLWNRLCWAKENLDGVQSDYRVVYEDNLDECAKILVPDPNWMACALAGWDIAAGVGILGTSEGRGAA